MRSAALSTDAVDLIQLQLKPGADGLSIRAVLESLESWNSPLLGVGVDTDNDDTTGASDVPGWTRSSSSGPLGLDRLVLMDKNGATIRSWTDGSWSTGTAVSSGVDVEANTMDAFVATQALDSSGTTWRVVGILGVASPSWFDGGGPIHDLAYVEDSSFSGETMQSEAQADVLSGAADAEDAVTTIDTSALQGGERDLAQPRAGQKNTFLYRSRLDLGEGMGTNQDRKYAGPYQPYVVWFPSSGLPSPPPLVVYLHGAMQTHLDGSYGGTGTFVEVPGVDVGTGVIDPKAVVMTPLGRNETSLGYAGASEQDILDAIADVSERFGVDEERVVLTGYSLGGVGTFNLAQLYPDKWAGAVEIVGAPDLGALTIQEEQIDGKQTMPNQLENLRNLFFRMAHSRADELELIVGDQPDKAFVEMMATTENDFRYYQFYRRDHLMFPVALIQCDLERAIAMGRIRDPARVTYSQEPALVTSDDSGLDLHHDRAYWISDMAVRGTAFEPGDKGTVDVINLSRGNSVPTMRPVVEEPHENISAPRDVCGDRAADETRFQTHDVWTTLGNEQAFDPARQPAPSNGLRINLTRVSAVTVDVGAMGGLDLRQPLGLELSSDGEGVLRLARYCPGGGSIEVPVSPGTTAMTLTRAANCH
jgi:pimeloyl-ACP methyl ester carboxylesterase